MRRSHLTTISVLAAAALCGCTRASDVLEPSAITPPPMQAATAQPASPDATASTVAAVPSLARTRLQIAPIVGATVEAAAPLTERLATKARERGITLAGSGPGQTPTLMLKGYFSALSEGTDTTVIYVWDVYDPSGNRLHRINGQQKAASVGGGEGWPAVAPATMQAIGDATIDQLATWLGTRAG